MEENIRKAAEEKLDMARKMEGFVSSQEYGIIVEVMKKQIMMSRFSENSCMKCETEKIIEKIDREIQSMIAGGTRAGDVLSKLN